MKNLEEIIQIVKEDILNRFPNCSYTIVCYLRDDNTISIECRFGTPDKIYVSKYYNNELTYNEIDIRFEGGIMFGADGREYYPKPTY